MASVYKAEKSPFWQCKGTGFNGEKLWLSTKLRDKKEAQRVSNEWQDACDLANENRLTAAKAKAIIQTVKKVSKGNPKVEKITSDLLDGLLLATTHQKLEARNFADFCSEWLGHRKTQTAPATYGKYEGTVKRFLESLGKRAQGSVDGITNRDVQGFINAEIASGRTSSTARLSRTVLAGIFNKAIAKGEINFNPAYSKAIDVPRQAPDTREEFAADHVRLLIQHASNDWRGMILVGFQAGLRLTDAANLTWANIDLDKRVLSYKPRKTMNSTKRTVSTAIHRDLANYIESLPVSDDPNAPLFPSLFGKETHGRSGLSNQFSAIMARAGIEKTFGQDKHGEGRRFARLSFHSLRHGHISRLSNSGIDADVRMKMVGHASLQVHQGYTHVDQVRATNAVDLLESVI